MANIPSSPILVTLMLEALRSSKTLVLTRATRYNNPEDGILHSLCCENLKSYSDDTTITTLLSSLTPCVSELMPPAIECE
jgi:hypothetical protein